MSTPVCCPSRATLLTGRYQHNTAVRNNSLPGNCCGDAWRRRLEPRALAALLHRRGYSTFYAGKYLNQVSPRPLVQGGGLARGVAVSCSQFEIWFDGYVHNW